MAAEITYNQPGGAGAGTPGARNDIWLGVVVQCVSSGTGTSWLWEMVDRPLGSSAVLATPTAATATFTPDVIGTYRIRLTIDGSDSIIKVVRARFNASGVLTNRGWAMPAIDEQLGEADYGTNARHWAEVYESIISNLIPRVVEVGSSANQNLYWDGSGWEPRNDLTLPTGGARYISVAIAASAVAGHDLTISAGAGGTGDTAGGDLKLDAGAKSGTGADGDVEIGTSNTRYIDMGSVSAGIRVDLSGTYPVLKVSGAGAYFDLPGGSATVAQNFAINGSHVSVNVTASNVSELVDGGVTALHSHGGVFTAGGDLTGDGSSQTVSFIQLMNTPAKSGASLEDILVVKDINPIAYPRPVISDGASIWIGAHRQSNTTDGLVSRIRVPDVGVVATVNLTDVDANVDGVRDLGQDDAYVYAAGWNGGTIAIISKTTNAIVGWGTIPTLGVLGTKRAVTVCADNAGKFYVIGRDNTSSPYLWRFDTASCIGKAPDAQGPEASGSLSYLFRKVRFGGGELWVANGISGTYSLQKFSTSTLASTGTFTGNSNGMDCIYAFGSVWVADSATVFRVNPSTMAQQASIATTISGVGIGIGPDSSGVADSRLLVADQAGYGYMAIIDPNTDTKETNVTIYPYYQEGVAAYDDTYYVSAPDAFGNGRIGMYKVVGGSSTYTSSDVDFLGLEYTAQSSIVDGTDQYQLLSWSGSAWGAVNEITLPNGANRTLKIEAEATGKWLYIEGGTSTGASQTGGNVEIYSGAPGSGGNYGNIGIGYDHVVRVAKAGVVSIGGFGASNPILTVTSLSGSENVNVATNTSWNEDAGNDRTLSVNATNSGAGTHFVFQAGAASAGSGGAGGNCRIVPGASDGAGALASVYFGNPANAGQADGFQFFASTGAGTPAGIRYDDNSNAWERRIDGGSWVALAVVDGTDTYQLLYWNGSGWVATENVLLPNGANRTIGVETAAAATAGDNLTVSAGAGGTGDTNGGDLNLNAGALSGTGANGNVNIGGSNTAKVVLGTDQEMVENAGGNRSISVQDSTGSDVGTHLVLKAGDAGPSVTQIGGNVSLVPGNRTSSAAAAYVTYGNSAYAGLADGFQFFANTGHASPAGIRYDDNSNEWQTRVDGGSWGPIGGASLLGYTNSASPYNTAVGYHAGYQLSAGTRNCMVGYEAGASFTNQADNIGIGYGAFKNATGSSGIAIGYNTLLAATSYNNIAIGVSSGTAMTSGHENVLVGTYAGLSITGNSYNTMFGHWAGRNTTGGSNTFVGYKAANTNTTGASNTCIGYLAEVSGAAVSNETTIGANAVGKGSNTVTIGATTVTHVYAQGDAFHVGDGSAGDKYVYAQNADANKPYIRYNDTSNEWELSNDGTTSDTISTGTFTPYTPWSSLSGISTTAGSTSQLSTTADKRDVVKVGMPLRVLDRSGVEYGDNNTQLSGYSAITGLDRDLLESGGALYFNIVDDTGGYYHLDIYSDDARTSANLVGHTATYNSTGAKTVVADNSSGLGGTVTVDAVTAVDSDIYVEFYKWYLVAATTSSAITVHGPPLSAGSGDILEVHVGPPEKVQPLDLYAMGDYALTASATLLDSIGNYAKRWTGPPARVAEFRVYAKNYSTSHDVNVSVEGSKLSSSGTSDSGLTISAAKTWYSTVVDLYADRVAVKGDDDFELTTTVGNPAGGDRYLTVEATLVLE